VELDIGISKDGSQFVFTPKNPTVDFKMHPDSWQAQMTQAVLNAAQKATTQSLALIQNQIDTHWKNYLTPMSPSLLLRD